MASLAQRASEGDKTAQRLCDVIGWTCMAVLLTCGVALVICGVSLVGAL